MHQSYFINHLNLLTMKMLTAIEPLLCGFYTHIILCNYLTNSEVITIVMPILYVRELAQKGPINRPQQGRDRAISAISHSFSL